MITLRPYQDSAIERVRAAMKTHRRILLVIPTGGGKTAIGSYMVNGVAQKGFKSIFSVHRTELLKQTAAAFETQGIVYDTIQAAKGFNPHHSTYVGAIQTMINRVMQIPRPDLLIIDEAHHTSSPSWAKFITAIKPKWIIGLTATPCRLDGKGLGAQFDIIVQGPTISELINLGYLTPFKIYAPSQIDLSNARTTAGDYNRHDISQIIDKPTITGDAVAHYVRLAPHKRAVVFCTSIGHAEHVAKSFNDAGFNATSIDGKLSPQERAQKLNQFANGEIEILTSCDLVSEGFDLPAIEVAISLRPTQSLSLWLQQVGRALRLYEGKTHAIILDHVGNTLRHGFPDDPREWSLEGKQKRTSRGNRDDAQEVNIKTCDKCFTVHKIAPKCPNCGFIYPIIARKIEQVDGELVELQAAQIKRAAQIEQAQAKSLEDLRAIAQQRGYKSGWADYIFKARQQKRGEA